MSAKAMKITGLIAGASVLLIGLCVYAFMTFPEPEDPNLVPITEALFKFQTPRRLAEPRDPTPVQLETVKKFLKDCYGWTEIGYTKIVAVSKPTYREPRSGDELELTVGPEHDKVSLTVNPVSGAVYMCGLDGQRKREEKEMGNRTHNDAISEDTAWNSAIPFLNYFETGTSRAQYRIEMFDNWTMVGPNDLLGAEWLVRRSLSYKEVPCRNTEIIVRVSAYSGKVLHVGLWPVVVPRHDRQRVTKEKAVKFAKAWLEEKKREQILSAERGVDDNALAQIVKVIAPPNFMWRMEKEPLPIEHPEETYYCWEVPFHYVQHGCEDVKAVLWVRIDNGNIIGGDYISITARPEAHGPVPTTGGNEEKQEK